MPQVLFKLRMMKMMLSLEKLQSIKFASYGHQVMVKNKRARPFCSWKERPGFCMQALIKDSG